ncbi:MAG: PIN domain-containing protein [Acidobacteriota bacterium]
MIALDTNILIRYFVKDDPAQSKRAVQLIRRAVREGERLFLNHLVLCEMVWVLESGYDYGKEEIAGLIEKVLLTEHFETENRDSIWKALESYRKGKADFADYVIGQRNLNQGCNRTVTFDRALKDEVFFEIL